MATRKRKNSLDDLPPATDPQAPLDSAALLAAAKAALKSLDEDLLARAKESKAVTAALKARHAAEVEAKRTGDEWDEWLRSFVGQVGAAWVLSCVFVRTLEDRGLLGHARIAGVGAADSQKLFFELAPYLTERDYLLAVFRELTRFPATRPLFDARHNPVWMLGPSAEAAKALLALFRMPSVDAPAFRFGQSDTRFLGDLYQDLDEDVRAKYALLQTPCFVESFILDRTLEPALERFGLGETTVIDPTCGSGHFLLGAFDRLFEHRRRKEPARDVRQIAQKALGAVYGTDINPYAVAIARFRLTLSFLEKGGFTRLGDAPALPIHLAVADSLLHNFQMPREDAEEESGAGSRVLEASEIYALEDAAATRDVLGRRHTVVVGNPPYITVKDAVLRERYRAMYERTAFRTYSLAAPFMERFFQLGRDGASVGMLVANSFMKREFGKKLIEQFLPSVNLELIVNTSGAFIPGHGTPTVIVFGSAERPRGAEVRAVLASRGEPSTPEDPEQGKVWRSIVEHWGELGFENEYISVARIERSVLSKHPWSLGGGGAAELKELLEERAEKRLEDVVESIGRTTVVGEDDIWIAPRGTWQRFGLGEAATPLVIGECVRDWAIADAPEVIYPYDELGGEPVPHSHTLVQRLWPWRRLLEARSVFGKEIKASGRRWWEHLEHYTSKLRTPMGIAFAFVATHNHFVLDRGGKVFNRSAPIIKLPEDATEEDHLALLAYLNSSTACFLMKQVFFEKSSQNYVGDVKDKPERIHYEFSGTGLGKIPIPSLTPTLAKFGRVLDELAQARAKCSPEIALRNLASSKAITDTLAQSAQRDAELFGCMVAVQEELDWYVYSLFSLAPAPVALSEDMATLRLAPGERLFLGNAELRSTPLRDPRVALLKESNIRQIESPMFKRPWFGVQGVFHRDGWTYDERAKEALRAELATLVEHRVAEVGVPATHRDVLHGVRQPSALMAVLGCFDGDLPVSESLKGTLKENSVAFLASLRHSEAGLEKRAAWERTWDLQRREDAGEDVGPIPVPPKYEQSDYRDPIYWRLRGKLDVPKERFISYPGCESDQDGEPVYGWAGWNHLQQAQALAAFYEKRKNEEAWTKERLTPMLAGLLELMPWVKQWHNEPSDEYGGQRLGDALEGFLDAQCRELGLTRDDLRAWRPPEKQRAKSRAKSRASSKAEPAPSPPSAPAPKPKRARKPSRARETL